MHETLGLTGAMLAAGVLSARRGWMPQDAAEVLHRFVIRVCLPALVLTTVPGLRFRWSLVLVVVLPWVLLLLTAPLVSRASAAFGWSPGVRAALLLCVPLGNTSFLGFPMLEALVGEPALPVAVLYDQLGSFLMLASYGTVVVAAHVGGKTPEARTVALRVITFPSVVALALSLALPSVPWLWPPTARAIAERLGDSLVPVAMFAVGLRLRLRPPRPRRAFLFGMGVKLVLMPALAWLAAHLAHADVLVTRVVVLESAMPAMISAGAMATMAGLAPELAAALVGWGLLVSLVTLPLWRLLL